MTVVRPLFSVTGLSDALGKPLTPLLLTAFISLAWILAVVCGVCDVSHVCRSE
ncbi:hypothetical protein SVIO_107840 [Streptomyces violaceusniger]|uniref:Uncharacterized protein n=2 Tax=Streptomyces violaceusniger TaxID=68280 RepID=A0A4D4LEV3_STRVO|nr:hypothetical protein SVIO_107840 [Streptomyces violaceusniger]